jgi:hypothetical protein
VLLFDPLPIPVGRRVFARLGGRHLCSESYQADTYRWSELLDVLEPLRREQDRARRIPGRLRLAMLGAAMPHAAQDLARARSGAGHDAAQNLIENRFRCFTNHKANFSDETADPCNIWIAASRPGRRIDPAVQTMFFVVFVDYRFNNERGQR